MSAGRQPVGFFIAGGLVFFTVVMPIVSKAHHPGNAIMMVVNGLAPKRHQYTSKHNSESVNLLQFLHIQVHSNHVTRTYRITAIKQAVLKAGWWVGNPPGSFVVDGIVFSHR